MQYTQLSSTGTFAARTPTPYRDNEVIYSGYTKPYLTTTQHTAVLLGSSFLASLFAQPIRQMTAFSFLTATPGDKSQVVVISDKRAMFFQAIISTKWLASLGAVLSKWFQFASLVGVYHAAQTQWDASVAGSSNSVVSGAVCGAATGVAQTILLHPLDVLRATAERHNSSNVGSGAGGAAARKMIGPWDVFVHSVRNHPSSLLELYRGGRLSMGLNAVTYSIVFGVYNSCKEDAVGRGLHYLLAELHLAACFAYVLTYPILSLKQFTHIANIPMMGRRSAQQGTSIPTLSMKSVLLDMKKKHGLTKVYDGLFRTRPFWAVAPLSVMITLYDLGCRRYTEFIHPSRKQVHGKPEQYLFTVTAPDYAVNHAAARK